MLRAGLACGSFATVSAYVLTCRTPAKLATVNPPAQYIADVHCAERVSEAIFELERKGFCCIGPTAIPRATSNACNEARSLPMPLFGKKYRPSAPGRFHRISFDAETSKEFEDLERAWLPVVNNFFTKYCPEPSPLQLRSKQGIKGADASNLLDEKRNIIGSKSNDGKGSYYRSECQLMHTAPGAAAQFFHQDNRRRGLTVIVPLVDVYPALGPTQVRTNLPFSSKILMKTKQHHIEPCKLLRLRFLKAEPDPYNSILIDSACIIHVLLHLHTLVCIACVEAAQHSADAI